MSSIKGSFALTFLSTLVLLSSTVVVAHNITLILDRYPDFSQFNSLLSQTRLADEINRRKTITILAVTNARLGYLSGRPVDVQKRILSNHVVLDYYDTMKLNKLKNTKTVLTTLYQATGTADDKQGFLDVIHKKDGSIVFGSAMQGAPIDAHMEGSVASQPYNISVLSISHPIIAPGIDGTMLQPVAAPPQKTRSPPPAVEVPSPAESPEEEVVADAPAIEAPEPSEAPADAPSNASADAPTADGPDADNTAADSRSAATKQVVSSVSLGFLIVLVYVVAA